MSVGGREVIRGRMIAWLFDNLAESSAILPKP